MERVVVVKVQFVNQSQCSCGALHFADRDGAVEATTGRGGGGDLTRDCAGGARPLANGAPSGGDRVPRIFSRF